MGESICYFLIQISKEMDKLLGNYDMLILGDFNSSVMIENFMKDFCETYDLENLIRGLNVLKMSIIHLPLMLC